MTSTGMKAEHLDAPHEHHVSPMWELLGIFGALLVLTWVTVAMAYVDLGEANLVVTLLIATVKASLVAWFFMHLRHDTGFNRLAFFSTIVFVALFMGFTLLDTGQYQSIIDWHETVLTK